MNLLKNYFVALFVVFLHFAAQITYWTDSSNRYFFRWERTTAVALVLDIFLIALVIVLAAAGIHALTRRAGLVRLQRALDHVLPLMLVSGLLSVSGRLLLHHPRVVPAVWMAAMFAIGFSAASPGSRLVKYAFNLCLIFSPAPLILSAQVLCWGSWNDAPQTEFTLRSSDEPKTPVFVFILDEWAYQRSTRCGEFRPLFENVSRLCEGATVFREARSPYHHTVYSLPRFIFQNESDLIRRGTQQYWMCGEDEVLCNRAPSLFQTAKEHDYNTYMLGWHLPYQRLLGDQADYCLSYLSSPTGEGLPGEMVLAVQRNLRFWTDPISRKIRQEIDPRVDSRHFYDMSTRFREEMFRIIGHAQDNTFALFHVPQPHGPHVFTPDGAYAGPYKLSGPFPSEYERALEYLDFYIGQIVDRLRASGRFDDALIVLTSDHARLAEEEPAFREDPDWNLRVPLIVKLPGQKSGLVLDDELRTNQLRPLFEAVFRGERDTRRLTELVQRLGRDPDDG